jgi:hypothetical protein
MSLSLVEAPRFLDVRRAAVPRAAAAHRHPPATAHRRRARRPRPQSYYFWWLRTHSCRRLQALVHAWCRRRHGVTRTRAAWYRCHSTRTQQRPATAASSTSTCAVYESGLFYYGLWLWIMDL